MSRTYRSFAKLNLHLEVLGRRADGYHELRTVFQSVSLYDEIEVSLTIGDEVTLEVEGIATPVGPDNLVFRAATRFLDRWGGGGVALRLHKRIPVGGGLGGGSGNAATVLLALRDLLGGPERIDDLVPVAVGLGADVPFFLVGGTAVGVDRGDRILPAPDLDEQEVWIVSPSVDVSTAAVFERYRPAALRERATVVDDLLAGGLRRPADAVGFNDLEATVLDLFPPVEAVYTALIQSGAERVQISGSGGSMFAFFTSSPKESVLASLLPSGSGIYRARTLTRRTIEERRVVTSDGEG